MIQAFIIHFATLASILAILFALGFFIRLASYRIDHSTISRVGILAYTHKRLSILAYNHTETLWKFIPLCTLVILLEKLSTLLGKTQSKFVY